jgi:hypothetical protein
MEFFSLIFSTEIKNNIIKWTNARYHTWNAKQKVKKCYHQVKWVDLCEDEFNTFIGIILLMGIIILPTLQDYWIASKLFGIFGVREIMSRYRFKMIKRFL